MYRFEQVIEMNTIIRLNYSIFQNDDVTIFSYYRYAFDGDFRRRPPICVVVSTNDTELEDILI